MSPSPRATPTPTAAGSRSLRRSTAESFSTDSIASYARRTPKRARNSPVTQGFDDDAQPLFLDPPMTMDDDDDAVAIASGGHDFDHYSTPYAATPASNRGGAVGGTPSYPPTLSVSFTSPAAPGLPTSAVPQSLLLGSPLGYKQQQAKQRQWTQPSPAAARLAKESVSSEQTRRREMSVPLLSESLSSFSLSHTMGPNLELDGSDTEPAGTPRQFLPRTQAFNATTPVAPRDMTYPRTAPPAVHHRNSLLGSPFDAKSQLFLSDAPTPAWVPRTAKSDAPAAASSGWMLGASTSSSTKRPPRHQASSSDEECGSWTSASSLRSTERHVGNTTARPSVLAIWGSNDADISPTMPFHPLPGEGLTHSTRSLHSLRSEASPLKRPPQQFSPPRSLRFNRNVSSSTAASDDIEPPRSPSDSFLARRLAAPGRKDKRPVSMLVSQSDANNVLGLRRTSEPDTLETNNTFESFLARCSGERPTKSDLTPARRSLTPVDLPSDTTDCDEFESPIRAPKSTVPAIPPRRSLAGLPTPKTRPTPIVVPNATPARPSASRQPASARVRPGLPRMPTEENVGFRTPVTQLFGDEKPSPAAFASTGLVKKRGSKFAIPRFQDVIKARNWSPVNANADTPSKSSSQTSSQTQRDEPEDEFEDTDSPLRPLRTAPFGRTSSHTRIPSAASDKWPGHVRIPSTASEKWSGHARVPSTASIGSRGLRRKNSAMFNSNGSIGDSMSDRGSPATPTKSLPFAAIQKFGLSTPSPSSSYPFDRRNSIDSPVCTPMPKNKMGRIRALSRGGPIHRASNPMLSTAFRSQEVVPSTPVDTVLEDFTALSANSSMGPFERDYTLIASLGHGEFSHVWKVRHKEDGEHCAIKMGRVFASSRNRQRQLEEVAILRRLSSDGHPNILKFIDSWEQSSRLYIRTELSECGDLAQYLASVGDVGGVGEGRVWKMLAELTSALGFIHSHHVLHLDLKPSNILLSNGGSLKIGDFGMSVFRHDEMEDNYDNDMYGPRGSRARSRFDSDCEEGDRDYLSPEGLKGRPGFEADVYSLGILVLEAALNIALPTNGDAWVKLRHDDFSDLDEHYIERGMDDVAAIAATAPGDPPPAIVSGTLVSTIKHMMASDPADRLALTHLAVLPPMARTYAAMEAGRDGSGGRGRGPVRAIWRAAPALVDEPSGWLEYVLDE